jgi:uncharacterized membrane protein YgcG
MEWWQRSEEPMSKSPLSRRIFVVIVIGWSLTLAGGFGMLRLAYAADPSPQKEYVAVFRRGGNEQPFAIIEKPIGVPIGDGSQVGIEAFALRVATIDATQARAALQRLPELDAGESQKLPPGFTVYADKRYVQVSYAGASQKYKLTFTDPADAAGPGGGGESGGSGGGGGGGGGSSM